MMTPTSSPSALWSNDQSTLKRTGLSSQPELMFADNRKRA
jgi:hypothetical protein